MEYSGVSAPLENKSHLRNEIIKTHSQQQLQVDLQMMQSALGGNILHDDNSYCVCG